ncbi:helix-turn-helix domain-containing protein [Desulfomonile tiedjei]|uniref:DNA-directed RNA polymerase specialized sigma subunit, sigma24 n=1 Tax=Desulfomonile tiedjei (strain ATCC 49306 / DSM 6799 / DCB-1) TaxID=706587 RepID=I4C913_DESTA|nr:helix-turn-helix domain-containing protein [Desulfomonile tiedjei]AFM26054.1 DNA-directed RNA polymerase specialized sigma subunit, sigma24 [Desulfomonile tiedjei DSM 6799]
MRADSPNFKVTVKDLIAVPPPESVVVLVVALLDGNRNAQAVFFEVMTPIVKQFVRKWNANHCRPLGLPTLDEDDDCQNVMMRLIYGERVSGTVRECDSPLKNWLNYDGERKRSLYRYVQWNVSFYLRDLRRNSDFRIRGDNARRQGEAPGNAQETEARDHLVLSEEERFYLRRCTRTCWERLNLAHQEVLESISLGFSQAQAAQRLGVSEATVSRWLRDAARQFRDCLEHNCPAELLPFETRR